MTFNLSKDLVHSIALVGPLSIALLLFCFDEGGQGLHWVHSTSSCFEFVGLTGILMFLHLVGFKALRRYNLNLGFRHMVSLLIALCSLLLLVLLLAQSILLFQ